MHTRRVSSPDVTVEVEAAAAAAAAATTAPDDVVEEDRSGVDPVDVWLPEEPPGGISIAVICMFSKWLAGFVEAASNDDGEVEVVDVVVVVVAVVVVVVVCVSVSPMLPGVAGRSGPSRSDFTRTRMLNVRWFFV